MVKVISLSDKAYTELKSHKLNGDSFSDTILRVFGREKKKFDWLSLAGAWKGKKFDKGVKVIEKAREEFALEVPKW